MAVPVILKSHVSDGDHDMRADDDKTGDREGNVLMTFVTGFVIMIQAPRMYHSNNPV